MKKYKTLLAGVVFAGVEKYLKNYFDSVKNQTVKDFDLLIVNDGLDNALLNQHNGFKTITITNNLGFAHIRDKIIEYGYLNNYSFLIFSDTDDFFSDNRIEMTKKNLLKYDFIFNKISIVNEQSVIVDDDFYKDKIENYEITDPCIILDRNIIGMGNSAINLTTIPSIKIPPDIIAVDWFLYSTLLLRKFKGRFTTDCCTYYRQHGLNIVGVKNKLNSERLIKGINVKILHYSNLITFCKKEGYSDFEMKFKNELIGVNRLKEKMVKEEGFSRFYLEVVNNNFEKIYSGWWSEILTLNKFQKYAH